MEKVQKARTSITIDPEVLAAANKYLDVPGCKHRSMSALVEDAVRTLLAQLPIV